MSIDLTSAHPCPDCRQCLTNADKCQYCAERYQLRAQVEAASNNARLYADRCTALEAWAWVERTGCSVRPFGRGWAASFVGEVNGHRVYMSSSQPTPLAAVLDAMEKEEKG